MLRVILVAFFLSQTCLALAQVQFGPVRDPPQVYLNPPPGGVRHPTLRDNELEMFFESSGDIWQVTRTALNLPFQGGQRVDSLSTITHVEESPCLSSDGLRLYFTRKPSGLRRTEIFVAARSSLTSGFGTPSSLGPDGITTFEGWLGSVSGDEKKVYLEVIRTVPPNSGTPLPEQTDLAFATRANSNSRFGAWQYLDSNFNTLDLESAPFINREDTWLFFSRRGPLSLLPGTLFNSRKSLPTDPFPVPATVIGVNDPNKQTSDPHIVDPGKRIYFLQGGQLVSADRILSANYHLPAVTAKKSRSMAYPILVSTAEPDIVRYDFRLFFDSLDLEYVDAVPALGLGTEFLYAYLEGPGRLFVSYRAQNRLLNDGNPQQVLQLVFLVSEFSPVGVERVFRISGTPEINTIAVARPTDGKVLIQAAPAHPPVSFWMAK